MHCWQGWAGDDQPPFFNNPTNDFLLRGYPSWNENPDFFLSQSDVAKGKKAIRLLLPGKTETYAAVAANWLVVEAISYTHVGRAEEPRTSASNTVGAFSRPWRVA